MQLNRALVIDVLGWGLALWLVGYLLGIALFFVLPPSLLGWVITPIGVLLTLIVLSKHVERGPLSRYAVVGLGWSVIAVLMDYVFIVLLLHPEDGYYKFDVYLYYALTLVLPVLYGWRTNATPRTATH